MDLTSYLNKEVDLVIDREVGSRHPKFENIVYPINYGYIPNTKNDDGDEIDVYVLGTEKPLKTYRGKVVAIIHRLNDDDDKLIVTANNYQPTDDEIEEETEFQEKYFKHKIIR